MRSSYGVVPVRKQLAVDSLAHLPLCCLACVIIHRKLTAETDSSSSNKSSLSPHSDAAAAGTPPAADDARLLRPVDPSKPGYYWKPVQGEAAAAAVRETLGPAANAENVLSYQVMPGQAFVVCHLPVTMLPGTAAAQLCK